MAPNFNAPTYETRAAPLTDNKHKMRTELNDEDAYQSIASRMRPHARDNETHDGILKK